MVKRTLSPMRALLAACVAALMVLVVQSPAHAALPDGHDLYVQFELRGADWSESYDAYLTITNAVTNDVGWGDFNSDPLGGIPGDAIRACDRHADGWGVEMQMDINPGASFQVDRIATTQGHNSPYCSGWQSGNIAENTLVALRVCMVKGTSKYCSAIQRARA
ncbi:hypothetical protein AB0M79_22920 [Polymorphospora sp. NPDC051019]